MKHIARFLIGGWVLAAALFGAYMIVHLLDIYGDEIGIVCGVGAFVFIVFAYAAGVGIFDLWDDFRSEVRALVHD